MVVILRRDLASISGFAWCLTGSYLGLTCLLAFGSLMWATGGLLLRCLII